MKSAILLNKQGLVKTQLLRTVFWHTLQVGLMQFGKEASKLPINFTVYGQKNHHHPRAPSANRIGILMKFRKLLLLAKNPGRFSKLKQASKMLPTIS